MIRKKGRKTRFDERGRTTVGGCRGGLKKKKKKKGSVARSFLQFEFH